VEVITAENAVLAQFNECSQKLLIVQERTLYTVRKTSYCAYDRLAPMFRFVFFIATIKQNSQLTEGFSTPLPVFIFMKSRISLRVFDEPM